MDEYIENEHWPCKEKNCWRCCDPVKISFRRGYNPSDIPIPKDSNGNPIWIPKWEIWVPEKDIDTKRIQIYECLLYDKENKLYKEYKKRPNICRNTSCTDKQSNESIDKQHKKFTQVDFIKIKK